MNRLLIALAMMAGAAGAFAQTKPAEVAPATAASQTLSQNEVAKVLDIAAHGSEDAQIKALDKIPVYSEQFTTHAMEIRRLLDAPAAEVCRAAARALWSLREDGTAAWIDAAQSKDGYTRRLALIALAEPRQPIALAHQADATRVMLAGLASDDPLIAAPAAEGLCRFWPGSASALIARGQMVKQVRKVLVDQLYYGTDSMIDPPRAAELALGRRLTDGTADEKTLAQLGSLVLPDLMQALSSQDSRISAPARRCVALLAKSSLAPAVADALRSAMKSNDDELRRRVGELAAELGEVGLPALIEGARSSDPEVRFKSVSDLVKQKESLTDPKVMAVMTEAVSDGLPTIRAIALVWATHISTPPDGLVGKLVGVVWTPMPNSSKAASQRIMAIESLGRFATAPKLVVPALRRVLNDDDRDISIAAIAALSHYGKDGTPAIGDLAKLTASEDLPIRAAAANALLGLGDEGRHAVAPYFVNLLRKPPKEQSNLIGIVQKIGELGPEAQPAVPDLVPLLNADDNELRMEVARVLGSLGPGAKAAIPGLTRMVDNKDGEIRATAVDALTRIAPDGAGLGPALVAAVYNADRSSADRFAVALRNSRENSSLAQRLTDIGANDPDTRVRETARRAMQFLQLTSSPAPATQPAA